MKSDSTNQILLSNASVGERRNALLVFHDLLETKTTERDWQCFFDSHPYVLSDTLSVKFDGLYRQVPLVSGIPDYVFHRTPGNPLRGDYGVIELKRPDQSVVGVYSSKFIYPSRHLRVAQQEATRHLEAIRRGQFLNTQDFFVAGNRRHAFIIIGMSKEVSEKCHTEFIQAQFQEILPPGFHVLTYDEILDLFSASIPPTVHVLFVAHAESETSAAEAHLTVTSKYGIDAIPCALIIKTASFFSADMSIEKGGYVADARNIMDLLTLEAGSGSNIQVRARGRDARMAVDAIAQLVRADFYEESEPPVTHPFRRSSEYVRRDREKRLAHARKEMTAYYIAEADGFKHRPEEYWALCEHYLEYHDSISRRAYFLAERDGFRLEPTLYWFVAERLAKAASHAPPLVPSVQLDHTSSTALRR